MFSSEGKFHQLFRTKGGTQGQFDGECEVTVDIYALFM